MDCYIVILILKYFLRSLLDCHSSVAQGIKINNTQESPTRDSATRSLCSVVNFTRVQRYSIMHSLRVLPEKGGLI